MINLLSNQNINGKEVENMKRNKKKGFTLIELIVVIAILGILAAVTVPSLFTTLNNSKVKADLTMAAQIGRSAEIYAAEINNPDVGSITMTATSDAFVKDYLNGLVPKSQVVTTKKFTVSVASGKATVSLSDDGAGAGGVLYNAGVPVEYGNGDTVKAFYTGT